jgi:hypothetical protein
MVDLSQNDEKLIEEKSIFEKYMVLGTKTMI